MDSNTVNSGIAIALSNVRLQYKNASKPLFSDLNLSIPARKWTCILGKSGCGKTTVLRYLAGLLEVDVDFQGKLNISNAHSLKGQIAYMAQQDLLLPWLSVLNNVCLKALFKRNLKVDKANQERALTLLEQVGLSDYKNAYPQQLSGGMRQRVALARTLMQDKSLVLMDEPFSALDAVNRYKLQTLACNLLRDKTVVLITHDPQEAVRLADYLYILAAKPAIAKKLELPATAAPRILSTETAQLQQEIINTLAKDNV